MSAKRKMLTKPCQLSLHARVLSSSTFFDAFADFWKLNEQLHESVLDRVFTFISML